MPSENPDNLRPFLKKYLPGFLSRVWRRIHPDIHAKRKQQLISTLMERARSENRETDMKARIEKICAENKKPMPKSHQAFMDAYREVLQDSDRYLALLDKKGIPAQYWPMDNDAVNAANTYAKLQGKEGRAVAYGSLEKKDEIMVFENWDAYDDFLILQGAYIPVMPSPDDHKPPAP